MSVVEAMRAEVKLLRKRDARLADGPEVAGLLQLAAGLDDPGSSLTSRAAALKELRETMSLLRALAPADERKDGIDELTRRRERRLAGGAKP